MAQDCPICAGSGLLLRGVACPLCDDGPAGPAAERGAPAGEHLVEHGLKERSAAQQPPEVEDEAARAAGRPGDHPAKCASEGGSDGDTAEPPGEEEESPESEGYDDESAEDALEPARASEAQALCERQAGLVERMLSPAVRVALPAEAMEEPAKLSADEVEKVFTDHVKGVRHFLYRDFHGEYSLEFLKGAYSDGLRAFHGTSVHGHLLALMRLIVHHGHAGGAGAATYLTQVAEAFQDCQALQARVIEQVGLEIRGVVLDFRGLVTKLVGDYKGVALKMLAHDRIQRRLASDDGNPTHYENRLTADLGEALGLNEDDVRRAALDEHAASRFRRVTGGAREQAVAHARELFDLDALLKVLMAEVNSFSASSSQNSLPRMFLDWAASRLTEGHVVFDEDTCSRVEVGEPLALAILEDLFLERPLAPTDEVYRGRPLRELFRP